MRSLLAFVLALGWVVVASQVYAAPADPFADIRPPERTTAQVQEFLRVSPPPFTQEDVDRWLAEVRPVVERVAGRAFTKDPVVRVVTRDRIIEALSDQIGNDMKRRLPGQDVGQELEMWTRARIASQDLAPLSCGQYIDGVDEILIPAENYPGILRLVGHEATPVEAVVKVVLAHELTHALQDQTLGGIELPLQEEPRLALRAVMEGHAIHVQSLVAEELGLDDGHRVLLTAMAPARITDVDRAIAGRQFQQRRTFAITYRGGYRFARRIADRGGMESLWKALEFPPVSIEEINNPHLFGITPRWGWPGEGVVFRIVRDLLGEANWTHSQRPLASHAVDTLFLDLKDAELARVARDAILGAGVCVAQRADRQATVSLMSLRLDDPVKGETLHRVFEEMTRTTHKKLTRIASASELHRAHYDAIPCEGASRFAYTIQPEPGVTEETVIINVWRGSNFVWYSTVGNVFNADEAATVIRAVLDAMDEGGVE